VGTDGLTQDCCLELYRLQDHRKLLEDLTSLHDINRATYIDGEERSFQGRSLKNDIKHVRIPIL
jgi:hypothetical protein